jgi:outer membrane protein OmpA-like peptidoglycan-associated protein
VAVKYIRMKIKITLIASLMLTVGAVSAQIENSNSNGSLEFLQVCMKDPEPVSILRMNDKINMDSSSSYAPFITADELTLFFTSDRMSPYSGKVNRHGIESSFVAHRNSLSSEWQIDYLSNAVNAKFNDAVAGISSDGQKVFVHRSSNDIYVLERNVWSKVSYKSIAKSYGIKLNRKYHISSCAISADENTFYITTNMPGGLGGYDVWKIERNADLQTWSDWQNLGASVNTAGDEITISVLPDNSAIFVSSNGRLGFGGFDLYRFDRINSNSDYEAVHLGFPVNTVGNDVYYYSVPGAIVAGKGAHAYYSTERSSGSGIYDIYFLEYHDDILSERNKAIKRGEYEEYLQRRFTDSIIHAAAVQREKDSIALAAATTARTSAEAAAKAALDAARAREKELLAEQQRIQRAAAEREAALRAEQKRHEDSLQDAFYKQYDDILSKQGYTNLNSIQKPIKGMKIYLSNILFDKGKASLITSSYVELDRVFDFMQRFSDVRIEVGGHTSSEGSLSVNQKLSEARAKSVCDYLIKKGVSAERVVHRGYNYSHPIESENTERGKVLNRRVEFIVL